MPKYTLPVNCDVLALLELARGSGYSGELPRRIARRLGTAKPPALGTFYPAMKRLLNAGHVTATKERAPLRRGYSARPRTFYIITERGRQEAQRLSDALRGTLLPPLPPSTIPRI